VSAAQRRSSVSAACLDAEASRAEARTTSSFVSDCTIGSIKRAAQGRKASHRSTRKSLRKLRKQQKMIQNGLSNRQDPIHLRAAPRSGAALTCQHPTLTCQRPIPMIYSRSSTTQAQTASLRFVGRVSNLGAHRACCASWALQYPRQAGFAAVAGHLGRYRSHDVKLTAPINSLRLCRRGETIPVRDPIPVRTWAAGTAEWAVSPVTGRNNPKGRLDVPLSVSEL